MEAFFTRERANAGVDLPLALPDGTPTQHVIRIRGVDSDVFKAAEAAQRRRVYEASAEEDKTKMAQILADVMLETRVALVMSWSFADPCTPDNVKKFLLEAPQIAEEIDRLAARRALFFKKGSVNSTASQNPSSN